MTFLDKAVAYIFSILSEDDTVKQFPKEFVSESAKWIRSWFLKDDSKLEAKLEDPARNAEKKKALIEAKLEDALEDPAFKAELEKQLAAFEVQKSRLKNVVADTEIDVQGSVHIGDRGAASRDDYDEKNVVKGSTIKAGGDFRLGDEVIQAGGNIHLGDIHYYGAAPASKAAGSSNLPPIAKTLRELIASARTGEAIAQLMDYAEANAPHLLDEALQLSARWEALQRKERTGILYGHEANVERNQVNSGVLGMIKNLP